MCSGWCDLSIWASSFESERENKMGEQLRRVLHIIQWVNLY